MKRLRFVQNPANPFEVGMDLSPAALAGEAPRNIFARTIEKARRAIGRHSNPVVPGITDIQPWMYYDRLTSAANAAPSNSLLFFTTPLSSTKTKLDTNLKQAGRLPDPKHFLTMAIRFIFDSGMAVGDIQLMIRNYYIEFEIGDKLFGEGHLDLYPGGAGIDGLAATTATTTTLTAYNNGVPNAGSTNNWGSEHGIHILQSQTFQVRAISPAAPTMSASGLGLNLRCVLDGILYREAQ